MFGIVLELWSSFKKAFIYQCFHIFGLTCDAGGLFYLSFRMGLVVVAAGRSICRGRREGAYRLVFVLFCDSRCSQWERWDVLRFEGFSCGWDTMAGRSGRFEE